jgi:hypothetical protein
MERSNLHGLSLLFCSFAWSEWLFLKWMYYVANTEVRLNQINSIIHKNCLWKAQNFSAFYCLYSDSPLLRNISLIR